jgi:ribosome-associated protein
MKSKLAPVTETETREHVRLAVAAAESRKAEDLKVLDLSGVSDFTDYFLVLSGTNERQVQAIADGVERALREHKVRALHVEGYRQAHWVLLDYGYMVVHVFDQETRAFYALERLWGDAKDVTEEMRS